MDKITPPPLPEDLKDFLLIAGLEKDIAKRDALWLAIVKEAVEKEQAKWIDLFTIGSQLSNVAFNWSQAANETGARLTDGERGKLKELQRQWDAAIRPRSNHG